MSGAASPPPEFATLSPLEPLMDKCVHCGFCLSTCPSYLLARPGNGLAARPHLHDAGGRRRPHGPQRRHGRALRHVSRLHGVRNRVPVRRPVCAAHRGNARIDRAAPRAARGRTPVPPPAVHAAALPRAAARVRAAAGICEPAARLARPSAAAAAAAEQPHRARARRQGVAPSARAHARFRNGSTAGRADDRLRAACVLWSRQRSDRQGAGRRRMRGAGAGRSGLLRRACASFRP